MTSQNIWGSIETNSILRIWLSALHADEVTAAPAEGLYGYSCNPFSEIALTKLMALKQRSPNKGLIVLISNTQQLTQLCPTLPESCQSAIQQHWLTTDTQQPTTLILPALPTLPKLLTGEHSTLAIRLPQASYMQQYLEAYGQPLVSTSLNLAGEPPATEASQIPPGIPALTLPQALTGQPSRIFNPLTNIWLR